MGDRHAYFVASVQSDSSDSEPELTVEPVPELTMDHEQEPELTLDLECNTSVADGLLLLHIWVQTSYKFIFVICNFSIFQQVLPQLLMRSHLHVFVKYHVTVIVRSRNLLLNCYRCVICVFWCLYYVYMGQMPEIKLMLMMIVHIPNYNWVTFHLGNSITVF